MVLLSLAMKTSSDIAPTVKVEITVAEVKRSFSMKYGVHWPSNYTATILPDGNRSFSELPFDFRALENEGYGKNLSQSQYFMSQRQGSRVFSRR